MNANIRKGSIIYPGVEYGKNFVTGHNVVIRTGTKIGNNCSIGTGTILEHDVTIEDDVRIHSGCFIPEHTILRKGCWIAPRVCFTNAKYPNNKHTKKKLEGVIVGRNAIVGANATILPGISIHNHAIVGAGSVVTKDVMPYEIVVGNPSKVIGNRRKLGDYDE